MGLLKEIAQSHFSDTSHREFRGNPFFQPFVHLHNYNFIHLLSIHPCLVVVLIEVDRLTNNAQQPLRGIIQKYITSCSLILLCNSTSKFIPAIESRCLGIRIPTTKIDEVKKLSILNNSLYTKFIYICAVLHFVCCEES